MSRVPHGWMDTSLGALCSPPQYGWTTSAKKGDNGSLRFLRTTDITRGQVDWRTVPYCSDEPNDLSKYALAPGDIVISRAGSVGFSCRLVDVQPSVFASYLIRFRPSQTVDGRYIAYYLKSEAYWRQVRAATSGITLANVNARKLAAITLPLAPRAEQDRIVAAIEEQITRLDAGMAALESARQRLRVMRGAVLEAAITGMLTSRRGKGVHVPKEGTMDWSRASVGDIAEVAGGITKNPKRRPATNPVPFLRVANVQRDGLVLSDMHMVEVFPGEISRYGLQRGDLLVVEGNGSPDQVGRSALWHGAIDPCVHQNHLIRVRSGPRILPEYLNLYWNAPSTRNTIQAMASSTSGLHTLSTGKVRSVVVDLPPLEEQRAIVGSARHTFEMIDMLANEVHRSVLRSGRLRSSVLSAAFAGQLVPQDPNDEPACMVLDRIAAERAASNAPERPADRTPRTSRQETRA